MSDITSGRVRWNGASSRGGLAKIWHAVGRAIALYVSRRDLAELDDHMLKDLGISAPQAQFRGEPSDLAGRSTVAASGKARRGLRPRPRQRPKDFGNHYLFLAASAAIKWPPIWFEGCVM